MTSCRGWKPQPSRRKHPEDMTMRKKRRISLHRSDPCNDLIDAGANLRGAFSARAAVAEEHPAWCPRMDLLRGQSFILPIAPFNEVGIDFNLRAEAAELAGLSSAMKRARQDQRERRPF